MTEPVRPAVGPPPPGRVRSLVQAAAVRAAVAVYAQRAQRGGWRFF